MCLAVLAAGPRRHRRHHSAPRRSSQRDWPGRRSSGISPPAERDSPLAAAPKIRARRTTPACRLAALRPPGGRGERGRRVTASAPARKNLGLRSAQTLFPSPHPHHHHAIPRASCEPRAISAVVRRRPIRLPVSIGLPPGPPATAASFPPSPRGCWRQTARGPLALLTTCREAHQGHHHPPHHRRVLFAIAP